MYLISYDITKDRVRNKISKELLNYGRRVQYSVFECDISIQRCERLYQSLADLLQGDPDGSIRIYHLCKNCSEKIRILGTTPEKTTSVETDADLFFL